MLGYYVFIYFLILSIYPRLHDKIMGVVTMSLPTCLCFGSCDAEYSIQVKY